MTIKEIKRRWSPGEIDYLRAAYMVDRTPIIAMRLRRSDQAVRMMALRIGAVWRDADRAVRGRHRG